MSIRLTAAAIALACGTAAAEVIELTASGSIDRVTGFGFADPIGSPGLDTAWSVRLTYDAAAAPMNGSGDVLNYGAVQSYELTLGGIVLDLAPGIASVQRLASSSPFLADGYFFFGDAVVNGDGDGAAVELQLFNFDPFLTSLDLPDQIDLAMVPEARIDIGSVFGGSPTGTGIRGDVEELTLRVIPAPGAAFVLGLAGLAAMRRR